MKKITHLILSIALLIFINGCADYKPIFGTTKLQFEISDHTIEGNKILGNKIYSKLIILRPVLKARDHCTAQCVHLRHADTNINS